MIKKLSLLCFLIIFINNCGYTPIYSNKDKNFVINKIDLVGDIEVNKILSNRLNIYKNNADAKRFFDIIINSKSTKTILTKDKKGNPTQFSQSVSVNLIITDIINNTEMQQNFTESSTYDSTDNKFDLKKYENSVKENLIGKITEEIIVYILSL